MQNAGNIVMNTTTDENKIDMQMRCQGLRHLYTLRGKNPTAINIHSDGCYNNALYSGVGKTPFQPSTQAIYLFAGNETDRNQIINLQTITKLCSKRRNDLKLNAIMWGNVLLTLQWLQALAMKNSGHDRVSCICLVLDWKRSS